MRHILILALALSTSLTASSQTKGTLSYKSTTRAFTVDLKYAAYVTGPDLLDPARTIRRLVFSATDLSATIGKCTTLGCADGSGVDAIMVDIVDGPRLEYWLNVNDGLVQYSGTVDKAALTLTTDTPARLAGKLVFDGSAAGGAKLSAEFDARLAKAFTAR